MTGHRELCDAVDMAAMMGHLEEFSKRIKLSGTEEELESFRYLETRMKEYGFETKLIMHDAYISLPDAARIEAQGFAPDCITHSFSRASGADGVSGVVVHVGTGTPADFEGLDMRGKIALIDGIATPGASLAASRAGCVGQIHVSPVEHKYEMCISSVWGSPTTEQLDLLPTTVVTSVQHSDGAKLKEMLAAGEVQATLTAEVDTRWRKTPILETNLTAPTAEDDSFVLFSGHHDTWYYGVMDNGSANATMLEVARLVAQNRQSLRRHMRICFWSGHSHGRYSGSAWYADNRFAELEANCVAHVNIDSVGATGNTVLTDAISSHELFAVGAEAVKEQGGQEMTGHRMSRAGDQSFWGIGIPSLFMAMGEQPISDTPSVMGGALNSGSAKQGAGFGWWWHTPDDLLDKIDPELQVRDTRIYVQAIWRLLTDTTLPIDLGRQIEALGSAVATVADTLGDAVDLEPVTTRIQALTANLSALAAMPAARRNAVLLGVTRALVPLDYTTGDRFQPDPALKQNPYPVLDPLRKLGQAEPNSDAARFAAVAAQRSINRVVHALDIARLRVSHEA